MNFLTARVPVWEIQVFELFNSKIWHRLDGELWTRYSSLAFRFAFPVRFLRTAYSSFPWCLSSPFILCLARVRKKPWKNPGQSYGLGWRTTQDPTPGIFKPQQHSNERYMLPAYTTINISVFLSSFSFPHWTWAPEDCRVPWILHKVGDTLCPVSSGALEGLKRLLD